MPITIKCKHCGSEDVTRNAEVAWNKGTQAWDIVVVVFDNATCEACEGETTLIEEEK